MEHRRIVSLVPSLTELVWWLGVGDQLVGRTRFCTEPTGAIETIPAMGGTKNPSIDRILAARPDLVIANKEENREEDVETLRAAGIRVLVTDPNSVEAAVAMIRELGATLGRREQSEVLGADVERELAVASGGPGIRVYAAVWHNPMMGLGGQSYGDSLLAACGATNLLAHRPRYPEVTLDELRAMRPALILLPDEPFPFDAGHAALYGEIAPARVIDGKLLWWYGPRMPAAIRALRQILTVEGARC